MALPEKTVESPFTSPSRQDGTQSRPSLLPAFEPLSSSPGLPRPLKRKHEGSPSTRPPISRHYPTPVPTSSTHIQTSSPSRRSMTRPAIQRTTSTLSERVPLGDLPTAELSNNGQPLLIGRSSNSSHFQLSANRLISRVHVQATYHDASEDHPAGQVIIKCLGWNGARVHCQAQRFDLGKGDTFASDKPHAAIMLDVHDARVMINWPATRTGRSLSTYSDATERAYGSPVRTPRPDAFASSPPVAAHLHSPVSPSPRRLAATASSTFLGLPPLDEPSVQVYEDAPSPDQSAEPVGQPANSPTTHAQGPSAPTASSSSSSLSSIDDLSDRDEENDPIIHSFGPFGANLLPRMASFQAVSPDRRRAPLKANPSPQQRQNASDEKPQITKPTVDLAPLTNHVINQLAFSRLHSLPLSAIFNNLPASWRLDHDKESPARAENRPPGKASDKIRVTMQHLKQLLDETPAVGEIVREGKDAAGKALEDEFYYVAEMDTDQMRKHAVESSLGKPGLRAVRKQHKQYFWKKPRH